MFRLYQIKVDRNWVENLNSEMKTHILYETWTQKNWSLAFTVKNYTRRSWRESVAVRSTCCSFRGLGLGSQHTHGSSKPFVTPFSGISYLFQPSRAPGMHVVHRYTCRQNTQTHKTKILKTN